MKFPQELPQGKVMDGLAMGLDILPTIFDVLGYEIPLGIDGKSLLPMIQNNVPEVHNAVYSEHVDGTQLMVRTKKWKYIKSLQDRIYTSKFSVKRGDLELYDLENDPQELKNVIAIHPDTAQALDLQLSQWLEKNGNGTIRQRPDDDEEVKRRLQALGYF
jgi:arylsulfatase A-like enzyme